jgi:DNA-binding winged helix-turn-helix (wHTH) protein/Tfp pilus assembly protein PilF
MEQSRKGLYEFGLFRLDAAERQLLRAGEGVPLTPKAFDLLLALVEQPGHLLEKEALLKAVWPDTFVEENNLTDNISRLRKTLGEGENGQKFIETVPKRGYRFVAEVKRQNGVEAKPPVEEPVIPTVTGETQRSAETQQTASRISSRAQRVNRSTIMLTLLALVVPALIGGGVWQYFWMEKRAEVQQLQFQGKFYLDRWTEDEVKKGIEYYNRAVALDPNSVSAYEGLALGWMALSDLHLPPREAMPKAQAAAMRALQLDESSVRAHISLGMVKTQYEWDWVGAEKEFKRAFALDPEYNEIHQIYGWHLIAMGRFDEARVEMNRALGSNPLNDFGLWGLGDSFYFSRQYEQAVEQYRRAIGVGPKLYWSHLMLGSAYGQQDKFTEAIAELNQAYKLNDSPQVLASLGYTYARSGQRDEAQKVIAELQETSKRRYVSPYDMATIFAGLAEKEQAMAWLEKAFDDRSGWLALWLKVDPKFDGLRADDHFRDLLRRIGHTP